MANLITKLGISLVTAVLVGASCTTPKTLDKGFLDKPEYSDCVKDSSVAKQSFKDVKIERDIEYLLSAQTVYEPFDSIRAYNPYYYTDFSETCISLKPSGGARLDAEGNINGQPWKINFDTGNPNTVTVTPEIAVDLGIRPTCTTAMVNGEKINLLKGGLMFGRIDSLELGGVTFYNLPVAIKEMPENILKDVIIGGSFFKWFLSYFDLKNEMLFLGNPKRTSLEEMVESSLGNNEIYDEIEVPYSFDGKMGVEDVMITYRGNNTLKKISGALIFDTGTQNFVVSSDQVNQSLLDKLGFKKTDHLGAQQKGILSDVTVYFGSKEIDVDVLPTYIKNFSKFKGHARPSSPMRQVCGLFPLNFLYAGGFSAFAIVPDFNAPHNPENGIYGKGTIILYKGKK